MRTRLITALLCALGIGAFSACANTDSTSPTSDNNDDGEVRSSGMTLTSDTLADTDVARMQFDIAGVDCQTGQSTGFTDSQTKDLEDMMLPGGISQFENAPFDEDSQHLFADAFFLVDAGCYNVETTPLQDNGQPSDDCEQAHRDRVSVEDGQTTEILLINQCEGVERGGLDVISAINHPPEIENLELDKFVSSCPAPGEANEVCVTASDPDDDPLEFEWSTTNAGEFTGEIEETSTSQDNGTWTSCAEVTVNRRGDYAFDVTVFDLDGDGNRMEEVLAEQDDRDAHQSRDSLRFPVYSGVDCEGRTATILMAIGDQRALEGTRECKKHKKYKKGKKKKCKKYDDGSTDDEAMATAQQLIRQSADWVNPRTDIEDSDLLYILDDNNQGEHLPQDRNNVVGALEAAGFDDVDELEEPSEGIDADDLDGYDVVWFTNPGWPMDDESTFDALQDFQQRGGGLVLEGNDMGRNSQELAGDRDLAYFHGLEYLDNGVSTCGDVTDNYSGNTYGVEISEEPLSAIDGIRGNEFAYDNDIDHVQRTLSGEQVLATATYESGDCSYSGPAVVAMDPLGLDAE